MKNLYLILVVLLIAVLTIFPACNQQTEKTYENVDALVLAVDEEIEQISAKEFKQLYDNAEEFLLIDVRSKSEHNKGYIPGAVNIPRGVLEFKIAKESFWEDAMLYMPLKEDKIFLYCKKGHRGALAVKSLMKLGYKNVINIEGGFEHWKRKFPNTVDVNVEEAFGGGGGAAVEEGGC